MDAVLDFLKYFVAQLLGRLSGPLNFRLVVMPTVVTLLALRADWKDAREGRPAFLGAFITDPVERRRLFRIAVTDVGRVFLMAIVLDTTYQWMVFRWVYPGQVLTVAVVCAVVPYVFVRGPITRLARLLHRKWAESRHEV
ncbi:MAG: hypothetical protein EHM91_17085 [Planctomycetota bacterium]|nr:MAG: hypothetical protein EHM91_17085 [Planctomycetota bacterium]